MASTDDWNERIERALVASQRTRFATIEGSEILDVDGLVLCLSNLPDPSLNSAFLERVPGDPASALDSASALARERGFPLGILLRDGAHWEVEGAIRDRGMRRLFSDPAMVVSIEELIVPGAPQGVRFRDADADDLPAIAAIDAESFGTAVEVSAGLTNERLLGLPGYRIVQALRGEEPVGQAIVHVVDGTAGVMGVAVKERERRKGIGAAVTAEVVRGSDAEFAWLFAREGARSVYERIGFRPLSTWTVWIDA
jgi:predicted N-acetyltransferase YhbS